MELFARDKDNKGLEGSIPPPKLDPSLFQTIYGVGFLQRIASIGYRIPRNTTLRRATLDDGDEEGEGEGEGESKEPVKRSAAKRRGKEKGMRKEPDQFCRDRL